MIANNLISPDNSRHNSPSRINWLSVLFGSLAILTGLIISAAVGMFGTLVLLIIPILLILVVALRQPQLGLMAFIIITVTQLSNIGIIYHGLPSLAQPVAALLFLLILFRMVLFGERPEGWLRAGPLLIVYSLVWFISLLNAPDYLAAYTTFIGFIKDALGAVIVLFFIQKPSSMRGAIWSVITAGFVMSAICVFQQITKTYDNNYWGFGRWLLQTSSGTDNHRLMGPYDNPNAFAQVLVVIIPLALDRLWHERKSILRIAAGLTFILAVLAVVFTYSRGGLLAMIFAVGLFFVLRRPNIMPVFFTAMLAIGILQFLPASYYSRILTLGQFTQSQNQISDQSFVGRSSENISAWQMFLDHPILGVGLGNFNVEYQTYSRKLGLDPRRDPRSPASLYLELLSEQGLTGTFIFLLLLVLIFRELNTAKVNFLKAGLRDDSTMMMALTSGFAGYLFSAIVKNSAYSNVFWVIVGIALAAGQVAVNSRFSADDNLQVNSVNYKE